MEASDWLLENFHTTLRARQITPSEQTCLTEPENCVKKIRTFLLKAACDFGLWKDVLAKPKVVSKPAKALSPKYQNWLSAKFFLKPSYHWRYVNF